MTSTTKPLDCLLHWLPATVLDVRGAGLFLVVNSAGFSAVANVIHASAHDGLVTVHETAEETLVQCTGVAWMASLAAMNAATEPPAAHRDTGLERFAQEYLNRETVEPAPSPAANPAAQSGLEPLMDESGYGAGLSLPRPASNDPDRHRVEPITSDWPGEIDAIASATRAREAASLRGNSTLDDALEAA